MFLSLSLSVNIRLIFSVGFVTQMRRRRWERQRFLLVHALFQFYAGGAVNLSLFHSFSFRIKPYVFINLILNCILHNVTIENWRIYGFHWSSFIIVSLSLLFIYVAYIIIFFLRTKQPYILSFSLSRRGLIENRVFSMLFLSMLLWFFYPLTSGNLWR